MNLYKILLMQIQMIQSTLNATFGTLDQVQFDDELAINISKILMNIKDELEKIERDI